MLIDKAYSDSNLPLKILRKMSKNILLPCGLGTGFADTNLLECELAEF